ncbi:MAG TPA: aminodeoxychorismate/anthranilate synthase component II [Gammaproteobacteria bacterium]|nr:aminodeoxychorismate/anthranilate synthase component II [Gammaproteobacteria bacterium]
MILLIDNYDSFTQNLYQALASFEKVSVFRNDKITLEEITLMQPTGIVLSPGPGRPEDAGICVALIQRFSGQIPILGVCLGHQALAIALGGQVIGAEEIVHGKAAAVFHYRQHLYQQMPLPFMAARYHSLVVSRENLPAELLVEAETADGLIMGMRHAYHPTFGVQFHPESVLTPEGNVLLQEFVKLTT